MNEENRTWEDDAREYVEGVKKCNEAPTWDLIHTAFIAGMQTMDIRINHQNP